MGFYYSCFFLPEVASKRSLIQTVAVLLQKDIDEFGLDFCLKKIMLELKSLVQDGLFDEKTKRRIQVRVICCLGTVIHDYKSYLEIHLLKGSKICLSQ